MKSKKYTKNKFKKKQTNKSKQKDGSGIKRHRFSTYTVTLQTAFRILKIVSLNLDWWASRLTSSPIFYAFPVFFIFLSIFLGGTPLFWCLSIFFVCLWLIDAIWQIDFFRYENNKSLENYIGERKSTVFVLEREMKERERVKNEVTDKT